MLRRLYDRTLLLANHRRAEMVMAVIAFAESSFFPIPPDLFLIPMILAARERAWRLAAVCTAASVLGGFAGYVIGLYLHATVGQAIIGFFGLEEQMAAYQAAFARWGMWIILIKGMTPIPYKLVTIASGLAHFDLFTFAWTSLVTRGGRFFLLAGLLWYFGDPIRAFIEKRLGATLLALLAVIVGLALIIRYLV